MIKVLDQSTINKIAAGEVVERPSSVVKELVENAIDAGATAVTVEIKDGGISFIRITDNGGGIEKSDVPTAFVRHATSKIMTIEDLLSVSSLGFRGEALASIAAVAQVECITKTPHDLTGIRYEIHGSREIAREEIGTPTGTTIIVRNLFYNVPARKKFLKTATTEGSYITELITRLALSRPDISFKYIINGNNKIATSGNGKLKDVIYHIYGKDISANLLQVKRQVADFKIEGYVGKAFVSKGNRSFEHYFVNGRYIRNHIVTKAIEEAYKSFVMIHKFPFTSFHLTLDSTRLDVNIHPTKMEFRYADGEQLFDFVKDSVRQALLQEEMIPDVSLRTAKEQHSITVEQQRFQTAHVPEPFEANARTLHYQEAMKQRKQEPVVEMQHNEPKTSLSEKKLGSGRSVPERIPSGNSGILSVTENKGGAAVSGMSEDAENKPEQKQTGLVETASEQKQAELSGTASEQKQLLGTEPEHKLMEVHENQATTLSDQPVKDAQQLAFPVEQFISKEARKEHRIIGQLFRTYWLIEYHDKFYIMDQHAAHEKVMFERLMKKLSEKSILSQQLFPPTVLHLDNVEYTVIIEQMELFQQIGFELEDFGDNSIVLRAMPDDIMGVDPQRLFDGLLNSLVEDTGQLSLDFFVEKLSGMACKAAIKGNSEISVREAETLLDELLTLENPYNCPHGRPTIITITKTELERKFKRIQN